ncbi:HAD family hydrolase [Microlunatus sp. Y2014]|uniref:HAD family hydrolase n=1 Tax=Microlunatus sp. Y2014 TaxID=3418488 RepID=UPI003DA6EEC4
MTWSDFDAVLFDLDGVLTPTAEVHRRAWAQLFTDFLAQRGDATPYTEADYYDHIDGRPRYEGVRTFLASRDIMLPEGTPADHPSEQTVCGLGNRKNDFFNEVLRTEGIDAFPGSVRLLDALADTDVAVAVVSSSRNARAVLTAAGLIDRFEVIIDGEVADAEGIAGKPEPDTFVVAAERVGAAVDRCVVVEDAVSGVRAGRAGNFGLVVGVDRGAGQQALTEAGADRVVDDLDRLIEL